MPSPFNSTSNLASMGRFAASDAEQRKTLAAQRGGESSGRERVGAGGFECAFFLLQTEAVDGEDSIRDVQRRAQSLYGLSRDLESVGSDLAGNRWVVERSRYACVEDCRSHWAPFRGNIGSDEVQLRQLALQLTLDGAGVKVDRRMARDGVRADDDLQRIDQDTPPAGRVPTGCDARPGVAVAEIRHVNRTRRGRCSDSAREVGGDRRAAVEAGQPAGIARHARLRRERDRVREASDAKLRAPTQRRRGRRLRIDPAFRVSRQRHRFADAVIVRQLPDAVV